MAVIAINPLSVVPLFFSWWLGELGGLVPPWLKRRFAGTSERIVLLPGEEEASLYFESGEDLRLLGRVDLASGRAAGELRDLLRRQSLDRAIAAGKLGVCLRIPATSALRTVIELPVAAEGNLDEVVSFELDRHTPFRADQVLFSPRILERNATTQRLRVEVLLVPRPTVEQMIAAAMRLDLAPSRIDIAEEAGHRAASDNLLRAKSPRAGGRGGAIVLYGLAGTAAILAIAVILLPILRAEQAADELAQQFGMAKETALREAALEKEIDALRKSELFLIDKKRDTPSVSALLFETTRLLPDTTWLADWQLAGNEVQLQGVSASASAVVGLLEQSHVFNHTTFPSPVTQDGEGREHFSITTQVARGGTP